MVAFVLRFATSSEDGEPVSPLGPLPGGGGDLLERVRSVTESLCADEQPPSVGIPVQDGARPLAIGSVDAVERDADNMSVRATELGVRQVVRRVVPERPPLLPGREERNHIGHPYVLDAPTAVGPPELRRHCDLDVPRGSRTEVAEDDLDELRGCRALVHVRNDVRLSLVDPQAPGLLHLAKPDDGCDGCNSDCRPGAECGPLLGGACDGPLHHTGVQRPVHDLTVSMSMTSPAEPRQIAKIAPGNKFVEWGERLPADTEPSPPASSPETQRD